MIRVRGLRFSWPGGPFTLALDAWDVPRGARVAVVGPSGCGKSTLLGLLGGELSATCGQVEVDGERLDRLDEAARRAFRVRRVGFVFQDYPLVPYLDAVENALVPYRLHPALRLDAAVRARAVDLLARLGLGDKQRRRPDQLSQGERQRVAIARALVTDPPLLLADEPTTGLDPDNADAVVELLGAACAERGATLVMVTHDPRLRPRFDATLDLPGAGGGP